MQHVRYIPGAELCWHHSAYPCCAVGPDFVRPESPKVTHYNHGGDPKETISVDDQSQRFENGVGPVAHWWKLFNSKELDAAVTEGLAHNPELQAAQASLRQSQDNLRAGSGIFYPQVSATFGQNRERNSPVNIGSSLPASIFNLTTLSSSVSYALDIFGGQRRTLEGLGAQVDQQRALTLGTYMMLTGNIVNTSLAIAAYHAELDEIEQLIVLEKDQISVAEKQFQAGITTYGALLSLRLQLKALEATRPSLQQKLSQAEHLLATLKGKTPAEVEPPAARLTDISLPRQLPLSLPSELVRQRPDILAAEAQLHAASAGIGVATAALFPSFTLNASYGQTSQSMNTLLNSKSNVWGLGANVVAPLFKGGTLFLQRRAAIDAYQQSFASYRQTVIAAFAQVADIVRALEHDAELTQTEAQAVKDSKLAMDLLNANYQAGTANYLQVMVTDIQYRQAKIGYLQAEAQQLQDTTALFVALGGGWSSDLKAKDDLHLNSYK
ncbi:MAG: efflux transporter outer membrane subunit [Chlorobiales bacterium]|nr:efflux transporter outer membrane subunit [Chlorobiales bacterium]